MKKIIIALAITLSLVIIGTIVLYQQSTTTYTRAKADTVAFVRERTNLDRVSDFHWFNGTETFLTVTGTNEEGQERFISFSKMEVRSLLSLQKILFLNRKQLE